MVRISNTLITTLNILTLICSLLAIAYSIWFSTHHGTTLCQEVIQKPLLYLGLSLLIFSLLGIIGSCCRVSVLMYLYLIVMYVLILGLIGFTVFSIIVTNKGVGQRISGKGFKEYRLGDYSNWLQKYVVNAENWEHIQSCLVDAHVCSGISGGKNITDFDKHPLSALQSGCCKPPTYCGFQFHNATFWTVPEKGPAQPDSDCKTWSNNQSQLCFDCNSCKAGVLSNIKGQWRLLALINACFIAIVIIVYSIGCCVLRNNHVDKFKRLRKGTA